MQVLSRLILGFLVSVTWFFIPYKNNLTDYSPSRYCAMDDFTSLIRADDGDWVESECLGNVAVVKVRASDATLATIATTADFQRIPSHVDLSDTLGDLTPAQRTAIRNKLQAMGYTTSEINAALPANWASVTLGQVLRFAATRRLKPRWDGVNIVLDGIVQACRDIADVNRRCFNDIDWARLKTIRDDLIAEWNATQTVIRIVIHPITSGLPRWERDAILVLCGQAGYAFDKIRPDTFPTTGELDNFNRANENPLSNGGAWSATALRPSPSNFTLKVVSNVAVSARGATGSAQSYLLATYGPDTEVHVTIATKPATTRVISLILRIVDPTLTTFDGYQITFTAIDAASDTLRYFRWDNNAATQLGSTVNQELSVGDKIGVDMISSTLAGYYKIGAGDWTAIASTTDSTYTLAGNIALEINDLVGAADDFGGGTVVGASLFSHLSKSHLAWAGYRM